jgi:hypothetical protein
LLNLNISPRSRREYGSVALAGEALKDATSWIFEYFNGSFVLAGYAENHRARDTASS